MDELTLRVLGRYRMRYASLEHPTRADLVPILEQAEGLHKRFRAWSGLFPQVLRKAQDEAAGLEGMGLVWQDRLGEYWGETDSFFEVLADLDYALEWIWSQEKGALGDLVNRARDATADRLIPARARLSYAFGDPRFEDHPGGRQHIAYEIRRLEEWHRAFEQWNEESLRLLKDSIRKARRLV